MNLRALALLSLCLLVGMTAIQAQIPPPPPVPQNLVATPLPNIPPAVKLTWQAPAGPWTFRVYRSLDDTMHFQLRATTPMKIFTDAQLLPGHVFFYRVTSVVFSNNGPIESPPSNIVSFTLPPPPPRVRGVIAGTVVDDSTGLPIRGVRMRFFRIPAPTNMTPHALTDSLGRYATVLDSGSYLVKAEGVGPTPGPVLPPYIPEWYDNAREPSAATPVPVGDSSLFIANFGLSRMPAPTFAFVSGTVTDTLGDPLRNATVTLLRPLPEMFTSQALHGDPLLNDITDIEGFGRTPAVLWKGRTDSLGQYRARVVSGRSYIAMATKPGYLPEFYDNKPTPREADVIVVDGDVTGINFSLAVHPFELNSVSGLVRDSLGTPVPSRILLLPLRLMPGPAPHPVLYGHTDSLGVYTLRRVPTGRYFVLAMPFQGYAPAFYKAGAYGVFRWENADTVVVSGAVTGIDIGVVPIQNAGLAQVRGRVLGTDGLPLAGVHMFALSGGSVASFSITDAAGEYELSAVPFGSIRVAADREGYAGTETQVEVGSLLRGNVDFVLSAPAVLSAGEPAVPQAFVLEQNYPNPFNPSTTIAFVMPAAGRATLAVYNLIGQELATLANGEFPAGTHRVTWNGRDAAGRSMASGLYFYRLKATAGGQEFTQMRKMVLMK